MSTYKIYKKTNLKLIKGGAGVMGTAVIQGVITTNSATIETKSNKTDWDELADICYNSAQKVNLTYEQTQRTLGFVRRRLNAGCR